MSQSAAKAQAQTKKKTGMLLDAAALKRLRKAEAKLVTEEKPEWVLSKQALRELRKAEAKLITEDDEPVDNPFSEKQQRLLAQTLYSSWTPPPHPQHPKAKRKFWAAANVGIFGSAYETAIAPDVFISLDAEAPKKWRENKAYFFWEYGKGPELVIELVSNRKGKELSHKRARYANLNVCYYVIYDPDRFLKREVLQVFGLQGGIYQPLREHFFPCLGLGLKLWHGSFENKTDTYLRWCDQQGKLLPTADERTTREAERAERATERAKHEAERAEHEAERAEHEAERAEQASARAAKLAAKLRELGIDPEQL